MICLCPFEEEEQEQLNGTPTADTFMKTHCFHYFHRGLSSAKEWQTILRRTIACAFNTNSIVGCLAEWCFRSEEQLKRKREELKHVQHTNNVKEKLPAGPQCPQCRDDISTEDMLLIGISCALIPSPIVLSPVFCSLDLIWTHCARSLYC
jgi:hypothetical protein